MLWNAFSFTCDFYCFVSPLLACGLLLMDVVRHIIVIWFISANIKTCSLSMLARFLFYIFINLLICVHESVTQLFLKFKNHWS